MMKAPMVVNKDAAPMLAEALHNLMGFGTTNPNEFPFATYAKAIDDAKAALLAAGYTDEKGEQQ